MVTHDRYFLDNVTDWTLELDRGKGIPITATIPPGSSRSTSASQVEGKQDAAKQRTLARELEWIKASPKARQAKSKARIKAYDELVAEAGRDTNGKAQITIPPGPTARRRRHRGGRISAKASATASSSTISLSSCRPAA